jgi:hypothetical protein
MATATERLEPLLEWMSMDLDIEMWKEEDDRSYRSPLLKGEVRRRLRTFIESFDGDVDSVRAEDSLITGRHPKEWAPVWVPRSVMRPDVSERDVTLVRLEELRVRLSMILMGDSHSQRLSSLYFRTEHRDVGTALVVGGAFPDVVLYLAARLVAEYDVRLDQCHAPMPDVPGRNDKRDWSTWPRCNGLYVVGGRGSERRYCSGTCKRRAKNPNWKEKD